MKNIIFALCLVLLFAKCKTSELFTGTYSLPGSEVYKLDINPNGTYSFQFIEYGYKKNDTIKNNGYFLNKNNQLLLNSLQKNEMDSSIYIKETYDETLKDSVKVQVHFIDTQGISIEPVSNISALEINNNIFIPISTKNPFVWAKKDDFSYFIIWYQKTAEKKYYVKDKKSNLFKIYQDYTKGFDIDKKKKRIAVFEDEPLLISKNKLIIFQNVELVKKK